jgi:hypothetical protein
MVGSESDCPSGECKPDTNECLSRDTGDKTTCEPCTPDDECAAYHYCVDMQYTGGGSAVDVGVIVLGW